VCSSDLVQQTRTTPYSSSTSHTHQQIPISRLVEALTQNDLQIRNQIENLPVD